ncbi:type IV pilin [Methanolacinia petrolearia]|uniref:type IV pilin n=1 Tax=Methanolacinia petrolearia TaxID=54120 RepID=UPI003BA84AD3
MKDIKQSNESAVSPVVGVMMMLVVTIILAAVVSAFASGVAGDTSAPPQASILATEIVFDGAYDSDSTDTYGQFIARPTAVSGKMTDVYVVFEHKGGDSINLNNIDMELSSMSKSDEKSLVSNSYTPYEGGNSYIWSIGDKGNIAGFSGNWGTYMETYPDHGTVVNPGDRFVLHADFVTSMYDDETHKYTNSLCWMNNDTRSTSFGSMQATS